MVVTRNQVKRWIDSFEKELTTCSDEEMAAHLVMIGPNHPSRFNQLLPEMRDLLPEMNYRLHKILRKSGRMEGIKQALQKDLQKQADSREIIGCREYGRRLLGFFCAQLPPIWTRSKGE